MDHEKQHYRRDERGVVRYDADGKGAVANLQQRTAVGKHRDGSVYLRSTDSEDLAKIKAAADSLGVGYSQRRGGASHFGRVGSYEHLHFEHPADVANVHAAIGYHLEDDGKVSDIEAHLQKLGGGLKTHVRGKDPRVDACMVNTEHAHQMSLEANKANLPEAHRSAGQFHRLSAQAHRAQGARPWTKGEGAHHVGLAILHDEIAKHHDRLAWAAHKRIQAELKRKAEMKARMEAMEEGRETKKAMDVDSADSAHAEGDKWVMPLEDAIAEHEELVDTLKTPNTEDDLEEAKEQGDELERMEAASGREIQKDLGAVGAGTDLSTLEGGGALRAENRDDELADATMGREVQKAAKVKLHTVARVQAQMLRAHPGMRMSASFEEAVKVARKAGITDDEILRTVKNATGAFAPLVKHLEENQ